MLEPVGTAPGLVVAPAAADGRSSAAARRADPRSSCCRARRASCSRCGSRRSPPSALRAALAGAISYRQRTLRLFGIPESEIAETLRVAEREGVELDRLEITTCLKRGEIEVVTRYRARRGGRL